MESGKAQPFLIGVIHPNRHAATVARYWDALILSYPFGLLFAGAIWYNGLRLLKNYSTQDSATREWTSARNWANALIWLSAIGTGIHYSVISQKAWGDLSTSVFSQWLADSPWLAGGIVILPLALVNILAIRVRKGKGGPLAHFFQFSPAENSANLLHDK